MFEDLLNLRIGDKLELNGEVFTVQERKEHKAHNVHYRDVTRFELGNGYVLEFIGDRPVFFELVIKKWFLFTSTRSRVIPIRSAKIL